MKFGKFLLAALRKPMVRKAASFLCAGFAVALILASHSVARAAAAQEYDYQWGITDWLSNNPGYYEGMLETHNERDMPPRYDIPGHGLEFIDANRPLDPRFTPYSFDETISDSSAYARDSWGNFIQGGWYLTPSSARKWDTAGVNGSVVQNWEYNAGGWMSMNGIVNHYQRWASYLYQRPKPTYTGASALNDDGSAPYQDASGRYWYKEGNVVRVEATAHDLEGYVRNFTIALRNSSGQGIGATFNFCSWSGSLNDRNASLFSDYTVGPSSDSGQQYARCILRARSSGEGKYTVDVSVDNRAGVYAQHDGSIDTGLRLGVDGTAPTAPQIVFLSGKSGGWSNQNTAFTLSGSTDAGSGFDHYEYSIDGGAWARYSGAVTITNIGWHTIQARAFDHVGNVSYSTAYSGIDREPPTCRVSVAASDWHVGGSPITLTYSDDLSGVAVQQYAWSQSSTGAGNWQNYSDGQKILPPGSGAWYLYWRATDNAGNTGGGMFGPYSNTADLAVKIQTPNAGYLTNEDVITSVYVSDNSETPIIPGDGAAVFFTVRGPDGSVCASQSKAAVCPDGNNNLLWFRWHTPTTPGNYTMTAGISASGVAARPGWTDTLTWNIKVPTENAPPQTKLTDTRPSWFSIQTPNPCGYSSALTWVDWIYTYQWNGKFWYGVFQRRTYTAALNASLTVTPTKTTDGTNRIVTATQDVNGNWTMKSGYGISESVTSGVSLSSPTGSPIDGSSATAAQPTEGRYPEFNYYYAGYFRLFDSTGNGGFQLKANPYSQYGFRTHYVPVWFPDGAYTALATVSQAWTPAGMLGRDATGTIQIQGALPDDWYVKFYS
ncbi:MAG: hypothetical protein ABF449_11945 [Ethanoligenens sp.]